MRKQWNPDILPLRSRNSLKLALPGYGEGSSVEIPFTVFVGGQRDPHLLVISGVHGDEYEGPAVLHDFVQEIDPAQLRGTLTLVPIANPQAFHAGARRNPADLGDLNRAFPGNATGSATERLAHLLFQELVLGNDAILSLHGWSKEAAVVPYAEYPDVHNEPGGRSCAAAHALDFEFLHPYQWPAGVLGEAALKFDIATVETEVGGMGTVTPDGQATYRDVVIRFMAHFGMQDYVGNVPRTPKIVSHTDLLANSAGLLRSRVCPGDWVERGQLLVTVHALSGECLEEVRAPRAGIVAILRTFNSVQPGARLVQLFWEAERE